MAREHQLEFRMEAFNLLNRTNFQVPDTNASNIRIVNGLPAAGGRLRQNHHRVPCETDSVRAETVVLNRSFQSTAA
jgi:hypothetical protein